MKISTKGRYGLRALVDLAVHSSGECLALSSIAERQNISTNYLEQVFQLSERLVWSKVLRGTGRLLSCQGTF